MEPEETLKERAKRFRHEAYEKAKARSKAQRLAAKNSPAAIERKQREKAMRREAYLKAKARVKAKATARRDEEAVELEAERARRDEENLKSLQRGDTIPPPENTPAAGKPERAKLRLIQGGP